MQIISGEINFLTRKKSLHLETFKPFLTHALTERLNHLKKIKEWLVLKLVYRNFIRDDI